MRNNPSGKTSEIEPSIDLKEQEKVIMTHLLYGSPEDHETLDRAYIDPELHPAVRGLIRECRRRLPNYISRVDNPLSMPIKVKL